MQSFNEVWSSLLDIEAFCHPWVVSQLFDSWSLWSIIAEHFKDEIFEILWKILSSNFLPISIKFSIDDQIVKIFILFGFFEWENTLDNNEEDDTAWEHIDLLAIVCFAFFDFRSHVCHCTSVWLEFRNFFISSKTKISYFQIHLIINKDILKFQITMNYAFALHVTDHFNKLIKEEFTVFFTHSSHWLAKIEKESTCDVFKKNIDEIFNFSARWF